MRRRWWQKTTRSMAAEFGPPPAADPLYAEALMHYSDRELMSRDRAAILAEIRAQQDAVRRLLDHARELDHEEVNR